MADALRADGYTILQRNFSTRAGEIDIIAFRKGVVAFVEVRSRTGGRIGPGPQESVDPAKQRRIIAAARAYSRMNRSGVDELIPRFDVAAVIFDQRRRVADMEYYEDAFRAG